MKITALLLCSELVLLFGVFDLTYSEEVECDSCPCQSKSFTVCGTATFRAIVCDGLRHCRVCGEESCRFCSGDLEGRFCTESFMTYEDPPRFVYPEFLDEIGEGPAKTEFEEAFCEDPGMDINGFRTAKSKEGVKLEGVLQKFPQDTSLIYYCKEDYYAIGEQSISCLASGEWSAPRPTCAKQIFCEDPGMDKNGTRKARTKEGRRLYVGLKKFPKDTKMLYYCRDGYYPIGRQSISCLASGEWSAPPPTCAKSKQKFCDDPGMDKWTSFRRLHPGDWFWSEEGRKKFFPRNILSYYCKDNYHPYINFMWCLPSGEWDQPLPRCAPL